MAKKMNKRAPKKKARAGKSKRGGGPETINLKDFRSKFQQYDALIRDPCSAEFTNPPYAGGESGYLARLTFNLNPRIIGLSGLTVGSDQVGNFGYQIQPGALPGYLVAGSVGSSVTPTWTVFSVGGTFLSSGILKSYRPVAACIRWVPTGAIAKRAGVIGIGYSNGATRAVGDTATVSDLGTYLTTMLERASNGDSLHECRWIPTPADETYGPPLTSAVYTGSGTLGVCGINVDGVADSATSIALNGYLEVTVVIEWTPSASQGLSTAPGAPPPFTSQHYQSTIKDMGAFLLKGVRTVAGALGSLTPGGKTVGTSFIGSVGAIARGMAPALAGLVL